MIVIKLRTYKVLWCMLMCILDMYVTIEDSIVAENAPIFIWPPPQPSSNIQLFNLALMP